MVLSSLVSSLLADDLYSLAELSRSGPNGAGVRAAFHRRLFADEAGVEMECCVCWQSASGS